MTAPPFPISRRQLLVGLGAGGALLASGGLAACARAVTSGVKSTGPTSPIPFGQPVEVTSVDGQLTITLSAAATTVPYGGGTRWALTYNGSTPGPTLRVRPGDLLVITLENRLDTPTNLHTHGLHVSPGGDSDNVFVMIDPGERHTYRYQIPLDHPSGTFWYHPHHHGQVARQVFGGMAGALIIEDELDKMGPLATATERVIILSDPNIGDSSAVLDVSAMQRMLGREGRTILLNGRLQPDLVAAPGTLERWRLINASPSRYYALSLAGHQLQLIASDGGRLAAPVAADELLIVPGERAEVLVPVPNGGRYELTARALDRGGMGMGGQGGGMGHGTTQSGSTSMIATLNVSGGSAEVPALPTELSPRHGTGDSVVTRVRDVTLSMGMGMGGGDGQFRIDGRSFDPDRVDIDAHLGDIEEWTIRNTSTMDHPFHLHVWPFEVVARSDGGAVPPGWKDTVNVPAGHWVRIRIPFRDFAGRTVYHCHILDHEDLGMMGVINVT